MDNSQFAFDRGKAYDYMSDAVGLLSGVASAAKDISKAARDTLAACVEDCVLPVLECQRACAAKAEQLSDLAASKLRNVQRDAIGSSLLSLSEVEHAADHIGSLPVPVASSTTSALGLPSGGESSQPPGPIIPPAPHGVPVGKNPPIGIPPIVCPPGSAVIYDSAANTWGCTPVPPPPPPPPPGPAPKPGPTPGISPINCGGLQGGVDLTWIDPSGNEILFGLPLGRSCGEDEGVALWIKGSCLQPIGAGGVLSGGEICTYEVVGFAPGIDPASDKRYTWAFWMYWCCETPPPPPPVPIEGVPCNQLCQFQSDLYGGGGGGVEPPPAPGGIPPPIPPPVPIDCVPAWNCVPPTVGVDGLAYLALENSSSESGPKGLRDRINSYYGQFLSDLSSFKTVERGYSESLADLLAAIRLDEGDIGGIIPK